MILGPLSVKRVPFSELPDFLNNAIREKSSILKVCPVDLYDEEWDDEHGAMRVNRTRFYDIFLQNPSKKPKAGVRMVEPPRLKYFEGRELANLVHETH